MMNDYHDDKHRWRLRRARLPGLADVTLANAGPPSRFRGRMMNIYTIDATMFIITMLEFDGILLDVTLANAGPPSRFRGRLHSEMHYD